ncbi:MAG: repeat-containing protein [Betaproteobacteria bacterium]|nr:repeat-containing protein [Betaproteobacteria bacterium]
MLLSLLRTFFKPRKDAAGLNAVALEHYQRGELDQAQKYFREAAVLQPDEVTAWTNLAVVLIAQQKYREAVPVLLKVIEMAPGLAEAHLDLGVCYYRLKRNVDAIAQYETAIRLKPDLHKAHANLVDACMDACDWVRVERWRADFDKYRKTHARPLWAQRIEPFSALLLFPGKIAKETAIERASQLAASVKASTGLPASRAASYKHDRIRLAYVSADLYDHATAHLAFRLFELHDRDVFEVTVYSSGPDDSSRSRKHIESTCDRFVDVRSETPARTAQRIRDDEIDILVDMKGYTANSRPQVFASRAAPVQVSYLGYPGTTGAEFIDYFISDAVATPPGRESEFTEKVVHLPGSYQVNDNEQPIGGNVLTRADAGLPESGFVYCSFNRLGKIDTTVFSAWMEILRTVDGSVLWLIGDDADAERNLRAAAQARGVAPERLVFSEKLPKAEHLARHRLADLFLDTWMCNAHTGASDALWAGLPLLTCPGKTFVTRVAASLLHAAGLPELVAADSGEYQALAVRLAREPARLEALRARLAANRDSCALFDTPRYVKHLESAYRRMQDLRSCGAAAESFTVPEDPATR